MAGEWLKFEANTPEKPEVFSITVAMGWDDPDLTVGKLLKVWRWFDQQTIDGNAPRVTLSLLDRISGVSGFAQAMCDVGWLVCGDAGISLPNFDRHNGKTAKDRCLTAKRVAKHKSNAGGNAAIVTKPLPREEKRREEKEEDQKQEGAGAPAGEADPGAGDAKPKADPKFDPKAALIAEGVEPQQAADFLQIRKAKKAPLTLTALDGIKREAAKAGLELAGAVALCCVRGWQGFKAEWITEQRGQSQRAPAKPSAYQVAHLDHSSTDQAMRDSMERHGIAMPEVGEHIEF